MKPEEMAIQQAREEGMRKGAKAALSMLSDLRGRGTDVQALDHIFARMQDTFGSFPEQVEKAVERAKVTEG